MIGSNLLENSSQQHGEDLVTNGVFPVSVPELGHMFPLSKGKICPAPWWAPPGCPLAGGGEEVALEVHLASLSGTSLPQDPRCTGTPPTLL